MASPIRTCVVCRCTEKKEDLLRYVVVVEKNIGRVELDVEHKFPGRGAYCHSRPKCFWNKKAFDALTRKLPFRNSGDGTESFKKECMKDVVQRALKGERGRRDSSYVETLETLLSKMPAEGKGPRLRLRL